MCGEKYPTTPTATAPIVPSLLGAGDTAGVTALADRSIGIAVRPWVNVSDYVPAGAEINHAIVEKFVASGVDYPASLLQIGDAVRRDRRGNGTTIS